MLQHKTVSVDRGPGRWTGLLEELHHPFMIGQGLATAVFLDVTGMSRQHRWCLVGEDELGVVRRVDIPRSWALELLASEAWCSSSTSELLRGLAEHLLAEAEAESEAEQPS